MGKQLHFFKEDATINNTINTIRNVDTLSKFKSELKKIDETENHATYLNIRHFVHKLNLHCHMSEI
jgi:hypothetical protein